MKFTIQKDVFVNQASDVSRAIQSKATISILTGIKITATNSGVYLTGSDAEISIESFLDMNCKLELYCSSSQYSTNRNLLCDSAHLEHTDFGGIF